MPLVNQLDSKEYKVDWKKVREQRPLLLKSSDYIIVQLSKNTKPKDILGFHNSVMFTNANEATEEIINYIFDIYFYSATLGKHKINKPRIF